MSKLTDYKVVHVPIDLHYKAKIEAAKKGITLKIYLAELIKKDLAKAS